ncbi:glycosyltransferase family 4 protein [Novosphingobium sp. M1R2S20]|uniref:Glycosyltransferase family 4 protein n=1 Tax=Novosphingobium rhizovicinum TaxID=3228928 RepID=A0ABV3RH93_9SPHN
MLTPAVAADQLWLGQSAALIAAVRVEAATNSAEGKIAQMKIVILSSLSWSLVNFRGALIRQMVAAGHEVIACAPDGESGVVDTLKEWGVTFRVTPMSRAGTDVFADVRTLWNYWLLLRHERPDVLVAYTQKPIIYGGIAARMAGIASFFPIMSGLGYVFSSEAEGRKSLRRLVSRLYRAGVRKARCVFVFNGDDRREMLDNGIIDPGQMVQQVPGSGVDTSHYMEQPLPDGPLTFLMMGRLMRDKGVFEFVEAARQLRRSVPESRFLLLGRPETENPTGIPADALAAWEAEGLIGLLPETRDVRPVLGRAHVFVLPSYYREGLPRTILEALSSGRPVITTDMPGCREPIIPGVNGLLVPPRDPDALARAMISFAEQPGRIAAMGKAARDTAVRTYDVDLVNSMLLQTMGLVTVHPDGVRGDAAALTAAAA